MTAPVISNEKTNLVKTEERRTTYGTSSLEYTPPKTTAEKVTSAVASALGSLMNLKARLSGYNQ